MQSVRFERCASCGTRRPLAELLVVTPVRNPSRRWYCCRPSLAGGGFCFRNRVRPASVESIAWADRDAAVFGAVVPTNARRDDRRQRHA